MKQLSDISSLFTVEQTRWIDVRAPVEFALGSMPGAINLPLLNDIERHQIGITYKEQGQDAAFALGNRLVSGEVKEQRIQAWLKEIVAHPNAVIFCFRGGLRSKTAQSWLKERGTELPIVAGGYKNLRRFLMEVIEKDAPTMQFRVVSGPTGSGKTNYLRLSGKPYLDLEAIANHRGSAFGANKHPQPTQVDFENRLALELFRLRERKEILVEDESQMIGRCHIPDSLFRAMRSSPVLRMEISLENRVENILSEYVCGEERKTAPNFESFRASVNAISRKLGGLRAQEILQDIDSAQADFARTNGIELNRIWIRKLLTLYYDPLYRFSQNSKQV